MTDPTTPRRKNEREQDPALEGDLPPKRPQNRPGIDVPEIERRPVGPEDEERKAPDDPSVS
jgi:hypothetical protein